MSGEDSGERQGQSVYPIGKAVLGAVWLFATASFFPPLESSGAGGLGRALFGVLAITHFFECIAFLSVLKKSPRPLPEELWQTFLFGIVHVSALRAEQEGRLG